MGFRCSQLQGLENTSIANVAEAAGIAKGSIYLQFESRQDLLAGLQADLWAQMLERPGEIVVEKDLGWAAKLDAVAEHRMRFEFDYHDLVMSRTGVRLAVRAPPPTRANALRGAVRLCNSTV